MSFKEIGDALKTKLDELITDGRVATGSVYNYDVRIDDGINTPCVIITPTDGEEYISDTAQNECSIPYYVRVLDTATDDRPAMEDNIRELADLALEKVKEVKTVTYSNGCAWAKNYEYRWGWVDTSEPYRVFEIIIDFICLEDN